MSSPPQSLSSPDIIDYLYIFIFMVTYRSSPHRSFNAMLVDQLASLNNSLHRPSITRKTIALFRKELVFLFNQHFFPETSLTQNDPIDLGVIIVSLTTLFDLEIPEEFFEEIASYSSTIGSDLVIFNQPIINFFSSLSNRDLRLYQSNFLLFLTLVIDFLSTCYFHSWSVIFLTLKQCIINNVFSLTPIDTAFLDLDPDLSNRFLPEELIRVLSTTDRFLVITEDYQFLKCGDVDDLMPTIELQLRQIFKQRPPQWYIDLIMYLVILPVQYGTTRDRKNQIIGDLRDLLSKYQRLITTNPSHRPATN